MSKTNAKTSSKKSDNRADSSSVGLVKRPIRREIAAAICFLLAVFSFIGYFSAEGAFIGFFVGLVRGFVGPGFFALPPVLLLCSTILCFHRGRPVRMRVICALSVIVMIGSLSHLFMGTADYVLGEGMFAQLWSDGRELRAGGILAGSITQLFHWLFHTVGAAIVLISMSAFFLLTALNKTIVGVVDAIRNRESRDIFPPYSVEQEDYKDSGPAHNHDSKRHPASRASKRVRKSIDIPIDYDDMPETEDIFDNYTQEYDALPILPDFDTEEQDSEDIPLAIPFMEKKRNKRTVIPPSPEGKIEEAKELSKSKSEKDNNFSAIDFASTNPNSDYAFPPLSLLAPGEPIDQSEGDDEISANSARLETAFKSFGVSVKVTNATRGPSVTRYEAELEAGIKLSKLTGLADDIALSLGTSGVRIAAMPNKISTVGIEVPNKHIRRVNLREILEAPAFQKSKPKLTFAIGMDISGESVVGSISKLPHMMVAGTTGSGKSVCLNSIIVSILYRATPDDVRFIMIDPKRVEFKVYNEIPHLLVPVVTDVEKAAGALQWAVVEMMKRYSLFSETNARDLEGYNNFAATSEEYQQIPQIVIVIDELADLMLTAAKEVEESIIRVAQMGRAAGVHLIIATQSPRSDVITGLMKANIPSRIALKVSSALESRIILDSGGNADKLVGNGDMLYAPIGTAKPLRVQGTWLSEKECAQVVEYIKSSGQSQYSEEVISEIEKAAAKRTSGEKNGGDMDYDHDDLLPQAVDVLFESGQASVSMLQRRLKLGYARAARIVDQMEQLGVVGPFEGSKPRSMLITKEQWNQMKRERGLPVDEMPDSDPYYSDDS